MNGGGPGSAIYKSTDAGETWTKLAGGLPPSPLGRISLDIYRGSPTSCTPESRVPARRGGGGGGGGRGGADTGPSGLYRTDDGGASWRKVSSVNPRPMYFSQVRIDPSTPDRVYMGGVKMQMTVDGGKSMETSASMAIHDDIHAIWLDPRNPDHVMIGGDGGIGISYDQAKTWVFAANLPVGLFYHVGYDMEIPYNVCGGMQDNYDWCGPSATRLAAGILEQRLVPDRDGRRIRLGARPEQLQDHLHGDAGRKHDAPRQGHRRIEEHPSDGAERHAGARSRARRTASSGIRRS